ncbi:MAG: ScyD/ScyE family protein [Pyrinomonadaceae bacterium]|nr:ScyD/ScyE family protein [Pyrinomonadaceae bacterium]
MKSLVRFICAVLLLLTVPPSPAQSKSAALNLSYNDLLKIVDTSICLNKKSWGGQCAPEAVKIHDATTAQELTLKCPGCLTELKVRGDKASGKLKVATPEGEKELRFNAQAPAAADLSTQVVAKLDGYYSFRFFNKAKRPRGLATDGKGNLLVTDFGTGQNDGKVWKIPVKNFDRQTFLVNSVEGTEMVSGMPSVKIDTTFQGQPIKSIVGLSSVRLDGSALIALTNRITSKEEKDPLVGLHDTPIASLLRINLDTGNNARGASAPLKQALQSAQPKPFTLLASLWDFEDKYNPDQKGKECDPFDLAVRSGYAYATDAGGNDLLRINLATGEMNLYASFKQLPNPLYNSQQPTSFLNRPERDPVPSGIAFGPDGALYVALLAGYPFPQGHSGIARLVDSNRNGNALDAGEEKMVVDGLTSAVGVAFDAGGVMYTSEYSMDLLKNAPGRICQIRDGKCSVTLTDKVISPTSIIVIGQYLYFSQEFLGLVGRLPLPSSKQKAKS